MNIIASNLLARREEKRYTQAFMAANSGMSQPNYSDIERGKTIPSIAQMKIFAEILQTTVDELIEEKEKSRKVDIEFSSKEKESMTPEEMSMYIKILENQLRKLLNIVGDISNR